MTPVLVRLIVSDEESYVIPVPPTSCASPENCEKVNAVVPTVIGSNGVEKIVEFDMNDEEKDQLNQTLSAVKKTVSETGL